MRSRYTRTALPACVHCGKGRSFLLVGALDLFRCQCRFATSLFLLYQRRSFLNCLAVVPLLLCGYSSFFFIASVSFYRIFLCLISPSPIFSAHRSFFDRLGSGHDAAETTYLRRAPSDQFHVKDNTTIDTRAWSTCSSGPLWLLLELSGRRDRFVLVWVCRFIIIIMSFAGVYFA